MAWSDKLADMLRLNDGDQAYVGYPQMQVGLNQPRQAGATTGFLEGATGMPSMQPKNPITDPNYDAYAQGKNVGELVGIGAMAVPAYAGVLRAGAPKAYNALENYMVKSGGMIPLEAYHGTPHKIEGAFDINKVGTGEGAQAYGHGMYFAENPAVAKEYADMDTQMAKIFLKTNDNDVLKAIDDAEKHYDFVKQKFSPNKNTLESNQRTVDYLKNKWLKDQEITGNLYKVDIPDEHIPNMLDWDKPLKEQTNIVEMLKTSKNKDIQKMIANLDSFANSNNPPTGQNLLKTLGYAPDSPKKASKLLNSLGIKGVRYLDQGSRNPGFSSLTPTQLQSRIESLQTDINSGGGNQAKMKDQLKALQNEMDSYKNMTSNFVVFDPSTVKILEENGIPTRKELIQQQIDKIE